MKMLHKGTGDVLEMPPPDFMGNGVVIFNGRIVERVFYSDSEWAITIGDGRHFTIKEWTQYIGEQLQSGAWRAQA